MIAITNYIPIICNHNNCYVMPSCVCVCVCVRERERERERASNSKSISTNTLQAYSFVQRSVKIHPTSSLKWRWISIYVQDAEPQHSLTHVHDWPEILIPPGDLLLVGSYFLLSQVYVNGWGLESVYRESWLREILVAGPNAEYGWSCCKPLLSSQIHQLSLSYGC